MRPIFIIIPRRLSRQSKEFENLIVLRTFSKLCGMAALRLGYAAACEPVIENLRKVRPTFDINNLAVLFAEKLLEEPAIIQGLIQAARQGKDFLMRKLSEAGIPYVAGEANFVLIDCHDRVNDIVNGLAAAKILVSGGFRHDFLKNYVRVTVGNREVMEYFWEKFIEVWYK